MSQVSTLCLVTAVVCCVLLAETSPISNGAKHGALDGVKFAAINNTGTRPLLKSQGVGGPNGSAFDDFSAFNLSNVTIVGIHSINISHGDQVDALQVSYLLSNGSIYDAPKHGNYTTPPTTILLESIEYVTKVEGKTNNALVDQLTFTTVGPSYETRVYGPFGKTGNLSFTFEGYILGFHGRSGSLLDNIGIYSLELMKKSEAYGGSGGSPFDDRIDGRIPPLIGISRMDIWYGDIIGGIQVEYIILGGATILEELRGDLIGNELTTITFDEGEQIIEMHGETGDNFVDKFDITTRKASGENAYYGPFGRIGKTPFTFVGNISGFFGTSGNKIDTLGVYYT